MLATNCLAQLALTLSQYNYTIKYWKTAHHGNAYVLSNLLEGNDAKFDGVKIKSDRSMFCVIQMISRQIEPTEPGLVEVKSIRDPVISRVIQFMKEG